MYYINHYKIDFEKVKTTEDVIRILKVLDFSFEPDFRKADEIKDLLILVEKENGAIINLPKSDQ